MSIFDSSRNAGNLIETKTIWFTIRESAWMLECLCVFRLFWNQPKIGGLIVDMWTWPLIIKSLRALDYWRSSQERILYQHWYWRLWSGFGLHATWTKWGKFPPSSFGSYTLYRPSSLFNLNHPSALWYLTLVSAMFENLSIVQHFYLPSHEQSARIWDCQCNLSTEYTIMLHLWLFCSSTLMFCEK